jgi:hypothetical protein
LALSISPPRWALARSARTSGSAMANTFKTLGTPGNKAWPARP